MFDFRLILLDRIAYIFFKINKNCVGVNQNWLKWSVIISGPVHPNFFSFISMRIRFDTLVFYKLRYQIQAYSRPELHTSYMSVCCILYIILTVAEPEGHGELFPKIFSYPLVAMQNNTISMKFDNFSIKMAKISIFYLLYVHFFTFFLHVKGILVPPLPTPKK